MSASDVPQKMCPICGEPVHQGLHKAVHAPQPPLSGGELDISEILFNLVAHEHGADNEYTEAYAASAIKALMAREVIGENKDENLLTPRGKRSFQADVNQGINEGLADQRRRLEGL